MTDQIEPRFAGDHPLERRWARRVFLRTMGMGAMAIGFRMPAEVEAGSAASAMESGAAAHALTGPPVDEVDSYLVIGYDNRVTLMTDKVELGNGPITGLMQILAEELDVSFEKMGEPLLADTSLTPNNGGTYASNCITSVGPLLRQAGASARAALLDLASKRFSVPLDELRVEDGVIHVRSNPSLRVSYGELIAGKQFNLKLTTDVPQKPVSEYRIVGKSIPRFDIPRKVTNNFYFVHDVQLPGMLHARTLRPKGQSLSWSSPGPKGEIGPHSVLEHIDESELAGVRGLVRVVPVAHLGNKPGLGGQFNCVGVICEREEQAVEAARRLRVTWAMPPRMPEDMYAELTRTPARDKVAAKGGDVEAALAGASRVMEAQYRFPYQAHASLGALCAVADVKVDTGGNPTSATVWCALQRTYKYRQNVATALGIPPENVRMIWFEGSGSYGSNNGDPVVIVDAAMMSKAVGRPVRVQWFREDTHGWESYGPIHLFNLKAGISGAGRISAYDFEVFGSGVALASAGAPYTFGRDPADFRMVAHTFTTYLLTAPLRAPLQPATSFATESFLDEIAAALQEDPLQFRLGYLDPSRPADARAVVVLKAAAEKFGWRSRPSPNPENSGDKQGVVRGRGIAYGPRSGSYCATIMEVEVDQSTGFVRPLRAVVGYDVGFQVNPEAIIQQIEGGLLQATGRALLEEIKTDGYRVSTLDWETYPILRFDQVPDVAVALINRPDQPIGGGVGEAPVISPIAAIANAVFDATGVRLRQVPLTAERVLEALKNR
ncbi:MAG: xanthine dehydrogenase family protein molybdopterin-binding subunit [Acidobacteria bacterium]|nr:xanthine dehydrogenase family protein molybdopterin-binding subunit [Acidobacteriota bacterium]